MPGSDIFSLRSSRRATAGQTTAGFARAALDRNFSSSGWKPAVTLSRWRRLAMHRTASFAPASGSKDRAGGLQPRSNGTAACCSNCPRASPSTNTDELRYPLDSGRQVRPSRRDGLAAVNQDIHCRIGRMRVIGDLDRAESTIAFEYIEWQLVDDAAVHEQPESLRIDAPFFPMTSQALAMRSLIPERQTR